MEKLLKLINEYEESRWEIIDDWLTEEEREAWVVSEEAPLWKEYEWHLRHCNAKTVAYEKATFDAYALSKKYGFISRLVKNEKIDLEYHPSLLDLASELWQAVDTDIVLMVLAVRENPIQTLISLLK